MLVPSAKYVAVTATISKYLQYDDALKQRFETQINHFLISVSALCPTTKLLTYRCLLEPMVVHHISIYQTFCLRGTIGFYAISSGVSNYLIPSNFMISRL